MLRVCFLWHRSTGLLKLPALIKTLKRMCAIPLDHWHSVSPVVDVERAALYVHWPFCKRRCTYCNFNKYINNNVNHAKMRKCLQTETMNLIRKSSVQEITSIFFGGGTPSLADPKTLGSVIETVISEARLVPDTEISMEINPSYIERSKMRDFQKVGINRVSIGVQTLNDDMLKILGRDHNSFDSLRCLETASELFHKRTSVDLIFGYPGHTVEMWHKELTQILPLLDDHISLYQLTLERGTQLFKDVTAGLIAVPGEDELADMYLAARELIGSYGFEQYEISNFAKDGNYCWHNISYWTGQQYIGIGPGSHGRIWYSEDNAHHRYACVQTLEPDNWMWEVERYGHATRKSATQTDKDILQELLSVGLRTKWGVTEKNWLAIVPNIPMDKLLCLPRTHHWLTNGFLKKTSQGLQGTPSGLIILDYILPDILQDIDLLLSTSEN